MSLTTVGPSVVFVSANLNLTVPVKSPQNCSLKVQGKLRVLLDSRITTLWHGKTSPFSLYPAAHHPNSTESMADLCCTRGLGYFCYMINLCQRVVSTGRHKLKPSLFILNAIGRYRPKKLLVEKCFYSVYFIRTGQSVFPALSDALLSQLSSWPCRLGVLFCYLPHLPKTETDMMRNLLAG